MLRFVSLLLVLLLIAPVAFAIDGENSLDDEVRLNPSITITGNDIHLGDIFSGYLSRPEKVVAQAPRPGQREVLSADWLANIARVYGLSWHPMGPYDRAIVYQPGKTITAQEIIAAVKTALVDKGLAANDALMPVAAVGNVTVPTSSATTIGVREAFFDPNAKMFSAVVEIPAGDPKATFVPLRGSFFPTVTIPVLKENAAKNTIITAAMIDLVPLPEEEAKDNVIVDANQLIGKAPKSFIKAGKPVLEGDVAIVNLVQVPVLAADMARDAQIDKRQIVMAAFDASQLPSDVILDPAQLVGKTPRRLIPANAPIRHSDVQLVHKVMVPITARDLPRGAMLQASDLSTISMNDADIIGNLLTDASEIVGRATKHAMRAGQMIHNFDIARPTAVERNHLVTIVYAMPMMSLTVQGIAQEAGGIGDVIRVSNSKTNQSFVAEVLDARTVRVVTAPQTASAN